MVAVGGVAGAAGAADMGAGVGTGAGATAGLGLLIGATASVPAVPDELTAGDATGARVGTLTGREGELGSVVPGTTVLLAGATRPVPCTAIFAWQPTPRAQSVLIVVNVVQ